MANAYYDFSSVDMIFIPYVGAGIGVSSLMMYDNRASIALAYQVKVGGMYPKASILIFLLVVVIWGGSAAVLMKGRLGSAYLVRTE